MPPCRYCLSDAHEFICLGCRTKYEALEGENRRLRSDVDYLRQLTVKHRQETKIGIGRAMAKAKKAKKAKKSAGKTDPDAVS